MEDSALSANADWLVLAVIAFNLTRAAATLAERDTINRTKDSSPGKASTATIRRTLMQVPARVRPRPAASQCT